MGHGAMWTGSEGSDPGLWPCGPCGLDLRALTLWAMWTGSVDLRALTHWFRVLLFYRSIAAGAAFKVAASQRWELHAECLVVVYTTC